jgi:hypothetical protein
MVISNLGGDVTRVIFETYLVKKVILLLVCPPFPTLVVREDLK